MAPFQHLWEATSEPQQQGVQYAVLGSQELGFLPESDSRAARLSPQLTNRGILRKEAIIEWKMLLRRHFAILTRTAPVSAVHPAQKF